MSLLLEFSLFSQIWEQKRENLFLYLWYFDGFYSRKGGIKCSIFSYFHQFVTRKVWIYCSICGCFCEIGDPKGMKFSLLAEALFLVFFRQRTPGKEPLLAGKMKLFLECCVLLCADVLYYWVVLFCVLLYCTASHIKTLFWFDSWRRQL